MAIRPTITFYPEADTLEIIFHRVIAYDNSEMYGTYTLHFAAGKLVALEIHDANVIELETDGNATQIGEFGSESVEEQEESETFVPDAGKESSLPFLLSDLSIADDAIRGNSHNHMRVSDLEEFGFGHPPL